VSGLRCLTLWSGIDMEAMGLGRSEATVSAATARQAGMHEMGN
jgi:hypothetical protein